jgi:hypothetical protein
LLPQGIESLDFSVIKADSNSSFQYPDLAITSSLLSVDSTGVYWINGEVQNTGNRTATNVRVIGTFYNTTNDVVAAGYSDVLTPISLSPSRSASFRVGAFDVNKTETSADRLIESYTLMVQTEGPLLSGIPPTSTVYTSSNSSSPVSPNPSDGSSSNSAGPDYLWYVAIVAIVIVAVSVFVVYSKKKKNKASPVQTVNFEPAGKRIRPRRKRRREA